MSMVVVKTQKQFNKALADGAECIEIRSKSGVWIEVTACDSSTVRACDSSTVRARDSSTVRACGSSTVTAYDSSTVTACGSSTVTACGSSTVTACGSSTVTAYDSSTVRAYGSSTVTATSRVAVHLQTGHARVAGGVLIDHTQEPTDPAAWCAWHDIDVTDGIATLYKAVNDKWTTDRGTDYQPGSLPSCDDWIDNNSCGGGLHFSPLPIQALSYHPTATRFLAVGVAVSDLRPILGGTAKCKAPRVVRACVEVDIDGNPVK
jgi:hypothetical protein